MKSNINLMIFAIGFFAFLTVQKIEPILYRKCRKFFIWNFLRATNWFVKKKRNEAYEKGEIKGRIESIIELLILFEEDIPDEILKKIQSEKEKDILNKWLKNAARADSLEKFIQMME